MDKGLMMTEMVMEMELMTMKIDVGASTIQVVVELVAFCDLPL
jgi:hypothetical protein